MPGILCRQRLSDTSVKLRLPFIIYYITILFQTLLVRVLADTPVPANTVDPPHGHISNKTLSAQIVGGEPAADGEFPYMVGIHLEGRLWWGGIILSSRWVLTSAFSVVDTEATSTSGSFVLNAPIDKITVGYGSVERDTLSQVSISNVWVHPEYNPEKNDYNALALLELEKPLPLSGKWSPARIAPIEVVSPGEEMIAIGWGGKNMLSTSNILEKIQLTVGTESECRSGYTKWNGHGGEYVCTTSGPGRDTCFADLGGPLMLPTSPSDKENFAGYLVGILHYLMSPIVNDNLISFICGSHDRHLNYFVRVAKHVDWIASVMGVDSSELLAMPETSEPDEGNELDSTDLESAAPFLRKRFDSMVLPVTLCTLALAIIAFNN
jgi:secreted trypsin-like serine protease